MPSVTNRRWLVQSLAEVGRFAEGIALGTEAVEIAQTADHPFSLTNALVGLGFVLLRKGDVEQAIPLLERGREVSRALGFGAMRRSCAMPLAAAYGLSGRRAAAIDALEDALIESASFAGFLPGTLAESGLRAGRVDEASRLGPEDLELSRAQKTRGREAWALHVLGEIAARRDDPEAADTHYRQAFALAERLGMRPLVAHCHLGLGKLHARVDQRQPAQEHLATATTMYREMDMRFWLEKAEAEMREWGEGRRRQVAEETGLMKVDLTVGDDRRRGGSGSPDHLQRHRWIRARGRPPSPAGQRVVGRGGDTHAIFHSQGR